MEGGAPAPGGVLSNTSLLRKTDRTHACFLFSDDRQGEDGGFQIDGVFGQDTRVRVMAP